MNSENDSDPREPSLSPGTMTARSTSGDATASVGSRQLLLTRMRYSSFAISFDYGLAFPYIWRMQEGIDKEMDEAIWRWILEMTNKVYDAAKTDPRLRYTMRYLRPLGWVHLEDAWPLRRMGRVVVEGPAEGRGVIASRGSGAGWSAILPYHPIKHAEGHLEGQELMWQFGARPTG